jgi:hypothetical protein
MTRKERRELARKIAKYEKLIQKSESEETIEFAKGKIEELITSSLTIETTLEDMDYIDDLVKRLLT